MSKTIRSYLWSAGYGHCFVDMQKLNYGADRNVACQRTLYEVARLTFGLRCAT